MIVTSLNSLTGSDGGSPLDPKALAQRLVEGASDANGQKAVVDVPYLAKGLLNRGEVSVIFGPPNCGKSVFATTVGMSLVRGTAFAGLRTNPTAVLHVAPEGAPAIHASTVPYIGDGTSPGAEPYFILPLRLDLRDKLHCATLVELVRLLEHHRDCDIGLILVDTLVLSIGDGDENSSRDVTAAMANAARIAALTHAHVGAIHHTNKLGELRGSSAILGACDTALEVSPLKDRPEVVRVRQVKQKSIAKGSDICFRLLSHVLGVDSDGDLRTTAMVDILPPGAGAVSAPADKPGRTPANDARRQAVVAAMAALSDDSTADLAFEPSVVRDACDPAAFAGCAGNSGSYLKAVSRVLEALAAEPDAEVFKADGRYRLVQHPDSGEAGREPYLFDLGIPAE